MPLVAFGALACMMAVEVVETPGWNQGKGAADAHQVMAAIMPQFEVDGSPTWKQHPNHEASYAAHILGCCIGYGC